jgi:glucose-6-phosphate dehydrogenase assembly protein OpcA
MEDVVTDPIEVLLPGGANVDFTAIQMAVSGHVETAARPAQATIVAIGPPERLIGAADALAAVSDTGGVRAILISAGSNPEPPARVAGSTVAIAGLAPPFINNAVAALRLSSLPTLVWWRGGSPEMLEDLADLADRLVLDEDDPDEGWAHALSFAERTAFSDIRWARLTRWRALMAHFFDIPEVLAAAASFNRLRIAGADRIAARLFAGWLQSSTLRDEFRIELAAGRRDAPIEEIEIGDGGQRIALRLAASGRCVQTNAVVHGHKGVSRTVALGDQSLTTLIKEELRIRSRDAAFERAVRAALSIS